MSSHWNSRRGSIASPLIRMAASFSSGKGLPFFISVLLSLSLSPYLFLAPSLSLWQGNSSLGINPLQIRLKHWVIIWPTGCSDQSSKACVCVCVSVCVSMSVCLSVTCERGSKPQILGGLDSSIQKQNGQSYSTHLSVFLRFSLEVKAWPIATWYPHPSNFSFHQSSLPSPLAPRLKM